MREFEQCFEKNNLKTLLEDQYGEWGHFTQNNADLILKVVAGRVKPVLIQLASLIAVTWCNESSFNFTPLPQVNCPCKQVWPHDKPECNGNVHSPWNWDVGPMQLNLGWTMRMSWQREIETRDTSWKNVFGSSFYLEPEKIPCAFNGSTFDNVLTGARRLLAVKGDPTTSGFDSIWEMQAVRYTGPDAQPKRLESWRKYDQLFREFFTLYNS